MNDLLIIFIGVALCVIALITIINIFTMPKLGIHPPLKNPPRVSLLVPARNEAAIIAQTTTQLLNQNYPNYELIILDDNSTDHTTEQILFASQNNPRLTLIPGKPLPKGWAGKNWACHQLSQHANGEILVFTDSDTQWQPDALNALITQIKLSNVDLYTVWSTQQTQTLPERLVVPLMGFAIMSYLPIFMAHYTPFSVFAAANGQCMAWKRTSYEQIGGHQAVANNVLDDVSLARLAKQKGYALRMADANTLIQCRMYTDWQSVRDGFAKNILAGYGNSIIALSLSILLHGLIFLLPVLWLLSPHYRSTALALIALSILSRALSAHFTKQRIQDSVLMPISVLLMTFIAIQSIYWHFTGGVRWKGRTINTDA